jgi:structural maintenance of chromosome 4
MESTAKVSTEDSMDDASDASPARTVARTEQAARLTISSLRLENFKSYGGTVDVGPFHKSFSSIVGPNGSGKSNVIDAMLFVFGRRAKQLRHSKLRELIHHSDTHPSVSSATVTVYFQEIIDTGEGDDDYEVVSGSDFSVARRAFKNDTSKYYLDGKEVKMSQVVDLLKAKGVDLDNNRFLILQGEVELISMMKPKALTPSDEGLLEYLEDIIGSNRHVDAIADSAKRVEVLNDERSHKLKVVKATERERDAVEDARKEAELYLEKERDLLSKKTRLTNWNISKLHNVAEGHRQREEVAAKELEVSKISLKEAEEKAKTIQDLFEAKKRDANKLSDRLNASKERYAAAERADIQFSTELKALNAKQSKLQQTAERESARVQDALKQIELHNSAKSDAEESIVGLQSALEKANKALDEIRGRVHELSEPLRESLDLKQSELLPFKDVVNLCQQDVDVLRAEHELLLCTLNEPSSNLAKATETLSQLKSELLATKAEQTALVEQRTICHSEVAMKRNELEKHRASLKKVTSNVSDLRRSVEDAKQVMESVASSSRLFTALYSATRSGHLTGVVGRLGDLGSIDPKYGTAAGAAAGSFLDNMVVKTAEDAQACIKLMREQNLGRSTFIILEKLEYLSTKMQATRFDGPRLFDLLHVPDGSNRIAFYLAMRDTLVANSIEEARRMAFKPTRLNRVVSLRGELIESSGAMTGGGGGPPRFRLGATSPALPITEGGDLRSAEAIQHDLEKALIHVKESSELIASIEFECRRQALNLEEIGTSLVKSSNRVSSLEAQVKEVTSSIPRLKVVAASAAALLADENSPEMKKIFALRDRLTGADLALQTAKDACVDMEAAIRSQVAQLQELNSTDEIKGATELVDKTEQDISHQRGIVSSSYSRSLASQKNADSAKVLAAKALKSIEQVHRDREGIKEKRAVLEDGAQELANKFKQLEADHDAAAEEVKSLAKDHSAVKSELKGLRLAELSSMERVNEAHRARVLCENEMSSMRKDLKAVQRKLKEEMKVAVEGPGDETSVQESLDKSSDSRSAPDEMRSRPESDRAADREEAQWLAMSSTPDAASDEELSSRAEKELEMSIAVLQGEVANMKPNIASISEYRRKNAEYRMQVTELDNLTAQRDLARKENDDLRKARLDDFMNGYSIITLKLKEIYQMITLGGDAELELVDSLDPFSEGIIFSVRPPKKSWKNISNLSGGEKTLSSLALVFALHHFKPTPLYFMDEIDAALDFKNVGIVANYVKERTKNAQFIIISLRNNMFELADRLVGIYKTHNTTKSVTVNPRAFIIPSASTVA